MLVLATAVALALVGASGPAGATAGTQGVAVESTWAGYALGYQRPTPATTVSATLVVPSLTSCGAVEHSSASFWAGLDGIHGPALEQAGISVACESGHIQYWAWWETVGVTNGIFAGVALASGDVVTATVTSLGEKRYQVSVDDLTSGTSGSTTVSSPGGLNDSAECIAEDPFGSEQPVPYAEYGTVTFTSCTVDGRPVGGPSVTQIDRMAGPGIDAATSLLGADGGFTVRRRTPVAYPALTDTVVGMAAPADGSGYWLVDAGGHVSPHGSVPGYGDLTGFRLNSPITDIVATPDGHGYWMAAGDGGIFSFGDAAFYGSMGGHPLNAPIVDLAPTGDGLGYWLVASDGGVFAFGDAPFRGSMGSVHLNRPVVSMATVGDAYWLVAADGGIFAFGAPYLGSTGATRLASPVTAMIASPDGRGYSFVAGDGGLFTFGDAPFVGSMAGQHTATAFVGMEYDPVSGGYWEVTSGGVVYAIGAPDFGSH